MRRSTEKAIAVQLPTLLVAVTALLVAQLLGGSRRGQGARAFAVLAQAHRE